MSKLKTRFRKASSFLLSALLLTSVFSLPAALNASAVSYSEMSALDSQAYSGNDLGATYTKTATTFKVWAPTASSVKIKRYTTGSDAEAGAAVIETKDMTKGSNAVWSITINGDLAGTYYTYLVTVNGTTKETVDIYARSTGVNGMRGAVVDLDSTDPPGWENDKRVSCPNQTDSVIWEVHVRDFSSSSDSGMQNKGKFLAFTETGTTVNGDGIHPTGIDYLEELGVTHVHLLPVYDYDGEVDETKLSTDQFNWGYDPVNYNSPEGSYSTDPYHGEVRVKEFKQMVQALHNKGIGVVMDVVYNHTYGKNDWFDYTVPGYYYRQDSTGKKSNASGCGNETASDRAMYHKYMIDSLTYWATEYHLDGFRFDLMGIHDCDTMNDIRTALDAIDPEILIYGEPWTAAATPCPKPTAVQGNIKLLDTDIAAFNDKVRDAIKGSCFNASDPGFIQGAGFEEALKGSIQANSTTMSGDNKWSKQPSQTVTYTSAHDNYTLYDKLVKSCKGGSGYGNRYDDLVAMNKLAGGIILTSQGMSFFQAGEEFARSKYGDENSYKSPSSINQLKWKNTIDYADIVSYYKGLIEIRKVYSPFRDPTNTSNNTIYFGWGDSFPKNVVAFTMQNKLNPSTEWNWVAVIHNANSGPVSVTLQGGTGLPTQWVIIADGTNAGTKSLGTSGGTVSVPGRSTMVLVDKTSFDSTSLDSKCTVTVNHVLKSTGQTYKTETLKGKEGTSYTTSPLSELTENGYKVVSVTGQTTGTFSKAGAAVSYMYELDETKYGTVTVKYIDSDSNTSIASDDVSTGLIGSSFSVSPKKISGYETSETAKSGTYQSSPQTITFRYTKQEVSGLTVHYYNSAGWSTVNMYVYTGSGSTATQLTGAWPGSMMTSEGNGWFVGNIPSADSALFIANAGANGPQDPSGDRPDGYSVSGECWVKGSQVYPTGKVTVNYTTTDGTVLAKETLKGMADGTNTYTTSAKTFTGYELSSAPANATGKYTAADITVNYVYNKTAPDPLAVSASLSASSITKNDSVTIKASASGGTSPYTYEMKAKLSSASSYSTLQSYSSSTSYTWTPASAGTYSVVVTAKDSAGTTSSKTLSLTVAAPVEELTNTSKISATSVDLGSSITVTGSSTGGTGTKQYALFYKLSTASSWTLAKGYSTTANITVTLPEEGTYSVCSKIKDGNGTEAKKYFTVTVQDKALQPTVSLSKSSISLGESVTVNVTCTGGQSPYQVAGYYRYSSSDSYTKIRSYSSTMSFTFTPPKAGTATLRVDVKDSAGTVQSKQVSVKVLTPLTNTSTLSATTVTCNSKITVKCSSTGGSGTKQYAVWYKRSTQDDWIQSQDYSTNTTVYVTPKHTGTYYIVVRVKDGAGTNVRKQFELTVNKALTNTSTVSSTWLYKGSSIKVSLSSAGGIGTKKYAVWYKKSTQDSWTQINSYSTKTTATVTPKGTGTYYISTKVKDSEGSIVKKQFTIKSYTPLANTSKLSSSSVTKGKSVKVTCSATGGKGTKSYAVYYKQTTSSSWTKARGYSTDTTVTITPKYAKTYTVRVKAKDGAGTIVNKDLTLNVISEALTNTSTISSSKIVSGSTLTINCSSSGGSGTKKYAVYFKRESASDWSTKQEYSTNATVTLKLSHIESYDISVKAKDEAGTVVKKRFTVEVTDPNALRSTSKISATTVSAGSSLTVTCAAAGGSSPYYYSIDRMKVGGSWTSVKNDFTSSTVKVSFPSAGTYQVRVTVEDSNGDIATQYFTVTAS